MKPATLVLITGDPRTGARPAEAVRLAAGVGTWRKTDVTLYLGGPAVLALAEWVDELVDEDNFVRYLPILGEFGRPVYVEAGSPHLAGLGAATLPYEEITTDRLAELCARANHVLRF
jgi:hypothetical protein